MCRVVDAGQKRGETEREMKTKRENNTKRKKKNIKEFQRPKRSRHWHICKEPVVDLPKLLSIYHSNSLKEYTEVRICIHFELFLSLTKYTCQRDNLCH